MLFSQEEERRIVHEIRDAERSTTGEIRIFVEEYCFRDTPLQRAAEVFQLHEMHKTEARNGVLIYISEKSRQFALFGDEGIFGKEPEQFWLGEKMGMREQFREGRFAEGVIHAVQTVGQMLEKHFPGKDDRLNQLPDEIIYG
jgi:uncharacterized membrane protein